MQTLTTDADRTAPVISIRNLDQIVADIVNQLLRHSLVNILLLTFTSANVEMITQYQLHNYITQGDHVSRIYVKYHAIYSFVYIVRARRT